MGASRVRPVAARGMRAVGVGHGHPPSIMSHPWAITGGRSSSATHRESTARGSAPRPPARARHPGPFSLSARRPPTAGGGTGRRAGSARLSGGSAAREVRKCGAVAVRRPRHNAASARRLPGFSEAVPKPPQDNMFTTRSRAVAVSAARTRWRSGVESRRDHTAGLYSTSHLRLLGRPVQCEAFAPRAGKLIIEPWRARGTGSPEGQKATLAAEVLGLALSSATS